jgi:hypothetical protein
MPSASYTARHKRPRAYQVRRPGVPFVKSWARSWLMSNAMSREGSQGFRSVSVYQRIGVDIEQGQKSHGTSECEGIPLGNISPLKCRVTVYLARRPGQSRRDVRFRLLASGLRGLRRAQAFSRFVLVGFSQTTPGRQLTTSHAWPIRNSLNRTTY